MLKETSDLDNHVIFSVRRTPARRSEPEAEVGEGEDGGQDQVEQRVLQHAFRPDDADEVGRVGHHPAGRDRAEDALDRLAVGHGGVVVVQRGAHGAEGRLHVFRVEVVPHDHRAPREELPLQQLPQLLRDDVPSPVLYHQYRSANFES